MNGQGLLPGGVIEGGKRVRDYAFRPADGALEMAFSEIPARAANTPEAVSLTLEAGLRTLAGGAPSCERIDALCVADQQFPMQELARWLGDEGSWFNTLCDHCATPFHFQLHYADLPIKPAGPDFPTVNLHLGDRRVTLRQPNRGRSNSPADRTIRAA